MEVVRARNPHTALPEVVHRFQQSSFSGTHADGTPYLESECPFYVEYERPMERLLFHPILECPAPGNTLFVAMCTLAGVPETEGARMRSLFGVDQLQQVVRILREDPDTSMAAVQLWVPQDLTAALKDSSTTRRLSLMFSVGGDGEINLAATCRVAFVGDLCEIVTLSMIQEVVAKWSGRPMGVLRIFSNLVRCNDTDENKQLLNLGSSWNGEVADPYSAGLVSPTRSITTPVDQWQQENLLLVTEGAAMGMKEQFFRRTAVPTVAAWKHFVTEGDEGRYDAALSLAEDCAGSDWELANLIYYSTQRDARK